MARFTAVEGYGLWRLSSNHSVGEGTHGGWAGNSGDSRSREAKRSSSSAMVDNVTETVAASAFARHCETILNLESITPENMTRSSWLGGIAESRSSWMAMGFAYGIAGWSCWLCEKLAGVPSAGRHCTRIQTPIEASIVYPIWTHPT